VLPADRKPGIVDFQIIIRYCVQFAYIDQKRSVYPDELPNGELLVENLKRVNDQHCLSFDVNFRIVSVGLYVVDVIEHSLFPASFGSNKYLAAKSFFTYG
jgi:hypothetical protein